ncbi:MAG: hypothetical protein N3Z28_05185 [Synechococcaceae cyanobacterium MAG-AL2]|uniref:LexA family protein n=1 Tax=Candidatus Regnicoccus frigidus TaxID=3074015 RepID=UPI0028372F16|nr:hypothetical protein [Candidatus Regnicoccus frigidus]MCT4367048.1 hypothetical protein [Candidatus Regnicoccus frigidus MAG-AL2]
MDAQEEALTWPQAETLEAIRAFGRRHDYAPTVRDLQRARGLKATSSVQAALLGLRAAGAVSWTRGQPRTLRVLWDQSQGPELRGEMLEGRYQGPDNGR